MPTRPDAAPFFTVSQTMHETKINPCKVVIKLFVIFLWLGKFALYSHDGVVLTPAMRYKQDTLHFKFSVFPESHRRPPKADRLSAWFQNPGYFVFTFSPIFHRCGLDVELIHAEALVTLLGLGDGIRRVKENTIAASSGLALEK